ncbi:MAG: N-acetyl sugar amidotransferase [Bermanella sp.]
MGVKDIKVCSRCLYTENHPLGLYIDDEGLCSGCKVHEEKDTLNWAEREQKLKSILGEYKNKNLNNYDCIIPVSGARDSYFIVHKIKHEYGMNPLLVTYNAQYNTERGIRNLAYLRTHFDCDIFTLTVNPQSVKKITRATLRRLGSLYWHVLAGQTVFPVQVAVRLKIPLIIWGAHQGMDQVGMYSHLDEVEMTRKYRKEHDLMGLEAEDLISDEDQVFAKDIYQFRYPDNHDLASVGVRGIYLNNYIRWDTKAQHEQMIAKYQYESYPQTRTFDSYNDVDSFVYSDLHDHIKNLKWGYGKVTDHVNREIRLKRLSREQACEWVKHYENKEPVFNRQFMDWLGITDNSLKFILDQHRNKKIWKRDESWRWVRYEKLLSPSKKIINKNRLECITDCSFKVTTNKRNKYKDENYILISKGWLNLNE